MDVLMIIIGIILSVIFMHRCGQQRKPVKAMLVNSATGLIGLIGTAVVTGFMGCGVAVNMATVTVASVLGVPGVAMILVAVFVI